MKPFNIAGLQTDPWVDRLGSVMLYCHISVRGDMSVYAVFLVAVIKHQPKGLFWLTVLGDAVPQSGTAMCMTGV